MAQRPSPWPHAGCFFTSRGEAIATAEERQRLGRLCRLQIGRLCRPLPVELRLSDQQKGGTTTRRLLSSGLDLGRCG